MKLLRFGWYCCCPAKTSFEATVAVLGCRVYFLEKVRGGGGVLARKRRERQAPGLPWGVVACISCGKALQPAGKALHCRCGGAWLAETVLVDMAARVRGALVKLPWAVRSGQPRPCPMCAAGMQMVELGGIELDRCAPHGIWFDATELDAVLTVARASRSPPRPRASSTRHHAPDGLRWISSAISAARSSRRDHELYRLWCIDEGQPLRVRRGLALRREDRRDGAGHEGDDGHAAVGGAQRRPARVPGVRRRRC